MVAERGIALAHTTILRWVQQYGRLNVLASALTAAAKVRTRLKTLLKVFGIGRSAVFDGAAIGRVRSLPCMLLEFPVWVALLLNQVVERGRAHSQSFERRSENTGLPL
jgi:hypothetical protein